MRFDLTDLQLFVHVVESGSLTAGAALSHLSLASASARVRGMEDTLQVGLLLRGRRGVVPTPAGLVLLRHARLVLRQIDEMHGELGEYASGLQGQLRLLCNTAALSEFLPQALGGFMRRHPNVHIELEERGSHDIARAVAEGAAEVGIVADSADLARLQTFPFRLDRLVAVMAAGVPERQGALAFADLLDSDFIGLTADSAFQRYLVLQAGRAGKALKVRLRLRSFDAICRMVESGVGIGVVPEAAALRCAQTMQLCVLPLSDAWSVRQLLICVRRVDELPAHVRQLIDEIKS